MRCSTQPTTPTLGWASVSGVHGALVPGNYADSFGLGEPQSQSKGGQGRTRDPSGTTRVLAPKRPREVARAVGGRFPAARGAGPRWKGRGLRGRAAAQGGLWRPSVTHAAVREAAAEAAAAVAAGAAGRAGGAGSAGRGPPLTDPRLHSDPRPGRACPGVLEKPAAGRGSHGAGARSGGGARSVRA